MKLTDEQIGKIAVEKFNLQECDEEYTYFILGYKEAVNKQFSLSGVVNSTKPKKASKTKKCDYCQKRKILCIFYTKKLKKNTGFVMNVIGNTI